MQLNHLEAFVAVAHSGSFSVAADRLHLTQPAISKRIAALELDLGARLFDRLGRRTLLTEAGSVLLEQADSILAGLEDARRRITDMEGAVRGPVGIATSHHIGIHRLPPVLRAFRASYPAVRLDLHFLESEEACAEIESGRLELAVATLPIEPGPHLQIEPLWRDTLHVVRAASEPTSTDHEFLATEPAILPDQDTVTRQIIERGFKALGHPVRVELETNALETIKMLVSIGLGWSVLPHTLLDDTMRVVDLSGLDLTRELGVIRERGRTLSSAGRAMYSTLVSCAEPGIGIARQKKPIPL